MDIGDEWFTVPSKHFKFIIFLLIMVIRSEGAREQGSKGARLLNVQLLITSRLNKPVMNSLNGLTQNKYW